MSNKKSRRAVQCNNQGKWRRTAEPSSQANRFQR